MDPKLLEKVGLTKNESIIYLALLRSGTSKTGQILKLSGLNSGKIYEILDRLEKKGLVSESVINNVKHFSAAPPNELLEYVDEKKKQIEQEEKIVQSLVPDLNALRKQKLKETKAVTYLGFRGIKTAAYELYANMKAGQEACAMGVTVHKDKKFNDFWRRFDKKWVRKRVNVRFIFSDRSEYTNSLKRYANAQGRVLTGITPAAIILGGDDKTLILNYEKPSSCILIYDKNINTSFKQFFNQLWKIAKP